MIVFIFGQRKLLFCLKITCVFCLSIISGQVYENFKEYKDLTKRVYHFTKVEFITEEGEFNEAICTLSIPELKEDNPPFVAIYYKRENSNWFTDFHVFIIVTSR